MINITFVTHSTSLDNESRVASGHYDVPLSEAGHNQAKELGRNYEGSAFDAVFCSDLQRSFMTGQIAFAHRDIPILQDPRLRECDYGTWTRFPSALVEAERTNRVIEPFPGGESYTMATERVGCFLQDIQHRYDGQHILIIGHRATQHALEHWLNNVPLAVAVTAPWNWQPGWNYRLDKSL